MSTTDNTPTEVRVIFSGPPGPQVPPQFIEVHNQDDKSIRFGEWRERSDGLWELAFLMTGQPIVKPDVMIAEEHRNKYLILAIMETSEAICKIADILASPKLRDNKGATQFVVDKLRAAVNYVEGKRR